MEACLGDYSQIAGHFTESTGEHCEFIQDKETMFLKIGGNVMRVKRKDFSKKEIINIFEDLMEG